MSGGLSNAYDLKDEAQAKEYLDNLGIEYRFQCYKENLPDGCHRLGDFLEAFRSDVAKAQTVFEMNCSDNKYGHSCFKAGNYRLTGRGDKEKDQEKAFEFFKIGCDSKFGNSCHNAGLTHLLLSQADKKKDYLGAIDYFKKGCEFGSKDSCYELSAMYLQGKEGIGKDMSQALNYSTKACDQGHIYGCVNVSVMYKKGDGVSKDLDMAEKFKQKAKKLHADQAMNVRFGN